MRHELSTLWYPLSKAKMEKTERTVWIRFPIGWLRILEIREFFSALKCNMNELSYACITISEIACGFLEILTAARTFFPES